MIIITAIDKHGKQFERKYTGDITIWRGDSFIMVEATVEGIEGWDAAIYDGYFPEDVVSIKGTD